MKKNFLTTICMTAAAGLLFCACAPFAKDPAPAPAKPAPAKPAPAKPAPGKKEVRSDAKPVVKTDLDKAKTVYDKGETKSTFNALSSVQAMKNLKTLSYKLVHAKTKSGFTLELERNGKRNEIPFPAPAQKTTAADAKQQVLLDSAKHFHTLSHFDWEAVAYQISAVPKKERTYLLKIRPKFKWYEGRDVQLTFDAQGRLAGEEVIDQKSGIVLYRKENTKFDQAGYAIEFKISWKGSADPDIWQISEVKRNTPVKETNKTK